MPIKLPKGLHPRRRSSAYALDEVDNPPSTSFRVLERPASTSKSIDGFSGGRKLAAPGVRPKSYGPIDGAQDFSYASDDYLIPKRKSAAIVETLSLGHGGHSTASSTYLSSTSTLPSSIDLALDTNIKSPNIGRKPVPASAATPRPPSTPWFDSRSEARINTSDSKRHTPTSSVDRPRSALQRRSRAMTASSASTPTPPRLLDTELALGSDMDDLSNMFANLKRTSTEVVTRGEIQAQESVEPTPKSRSRAGSAFRRAQPPSPIRTKPTFPVDLAGSPSFSHHSHEGLMEYSDSQRNKSPAAQWSSNSMQYGQSGSYGIRSAIDDGPRRSTSPLKHVSTGRSLASKFENERIPATTSRRPRSPPPSQPRKTQAQPASPVRMESDNVWGRRSDDRSSGRDSVDVSDLDPMLVESASLAAKFETSKPLPEVPKPTQKVMTPSQFEHYRQQRERQSAADGFDAEISDDEDKRAADDEEEDELERSREASRQRRKQEAHLSVYRQQMMKVTGEKRGFDEQPRSRPIASRASASLPDLKDRTSPFSSGLRQSPSSGAGSDEVDEDEDVPLGVLAAHGFPNKNRPPSKIPNLRFDSSMSVKSEPRDRSSPAASIAEDSVSVRRAALPAFARKLPQDPYYGSSLVNPSNRESPGASFGTPPMRGTTPPGMPPGGLVGVIAGEERARAQRRGSPSVQGASEPAEVPVHSYTTMGNAGHYAAPPMLAPADQTQLQMSAQMNQMMHMQMQWMQQMQVMMQGQVQAFGPGMPMPYQAGQLPAGPGYLAPSGQHSAPSANLPHSHLNVETRPASMMQTPFAGLQRPGQPHLAGQAYAPSIAPSERSNVGMASRYRPVSLAPQARSSRTSTMMSSSAAPWQRTSTARSAYPAMTTQSSFSRPPIREDDDDDAQAWAEMKRKKELRSMARKFKKDSDGLAELYPQGF